MSHNSSELESWDNPERKFYTFFVVIDEAKVEAVRVYILNMAA